MNQSEGYRKIEGSSNSSSAIIAYGVVVKHKQENLLPWYQEGFEAGEEDDWWRKINGYKPPFEIFDNNGDYLKGVLPSREQEHEYFAAQKRWMKEHPLPFTIHYFGCSYEGSGIIVTSDKYPYHEVFWGSINFDPSKLQIEPDEAYQAFVAQYLSNLGSPDWILASSFF